MILPNRWENKKCSKPPTSIGVPPWLWKTPISKLLGNQPSSCSQRPSFSFRAHPFRCRRRFSKPLSSTTTSSPNGERFWNAASGGFSFGESCVFSWDTMKKIRYDAMWQWATICFLLTPIKGHWDPTFKCWKCACCGKSRDNDFRDNGTKTWK